MLGVRGGGIDEDCNTQCCAVNNIVNLSSAYLIMNRTRCCTVT